MAENAAAYRVLARKHRPQTFEALIGQEAMVKTLENAIASGRLAQAFILTGVRGVGKTTTARLIARALNCVGNDGEGGPTSRPCGVCEPCIAIAESRHVDVLEMDAASRTGVDDIREIIDGVQYAPVSARYKVYIVDEVHMLSKSAFNALLKTLEEPPEHVTFIFATTEIRKMPVTVLSRCQRFDLKRVDAETLIDHLQAVCEQEEAEIEPAALTMIARAAEGSVRDGLSLLDQAIAHGAGRVTEEQVRDMLGLADRAQILDLTRAVFSGEIAEALAVLRGQYDHGADPGVVLSDMLETVHWLTRLKVAPSAADSAVPEADKTQGAEMAQNLAMADLTRAWQMLLKGVSEVSGAPSPISAAEMVLIRLAYAADLPSPAETLRRLDDTASAERGEASAQASTSQGEPALAAPPQAGPSGESGPGGGTAGSESASAGTEPSGLGEPDAETAGPQAEAGGGSTVLAFASQPAEDAAPEADDYRPVPPDFESLVGLFHGEREPVLATTLKDEVRLVEYRPGRLVINPGDRVPPTFAGRVRDCLAKWTGRDWQVVVSSEEGEASLREKELARNQRLLHQAKEDPAVQSVFAVFPEARLAEVRERPAEALAEEDAPGAPAGESDDSEESA